MAIPKPLINVVLFLTLRALHTMIPVAYLPVFVTSLFRGMPEVWKSHHPLWLCRLIVMQALYPRRKTLAELDRWAPAAMTAWRWRRVLKATYWDVHGLAAWWAQKVLHTLQPPEDGMITLTGDGSHTDKVVPRIP